MSTIAIVGDGPGGLSAALFLAKNGHDVTVFGVDETAMHHALLRNYLGVDETPGSVFQERAVRQVEGFGAVIVRSRVSAVEATAEGFTLTLEDGSSKAANYLILSEGREPVLARALGADTDEAGGIAVDRDQRTSVPGVYAVGRSTRPTRSQAIISAGAGAAAALDVLAREAGADVQDWDKP
jgi:thioredoxin reductase (NADPH)